MLSFSYEEHSENKIIVQSELFIGPGALKSSIQKRVLQDCQRHKSEPTEYVSILSGILVGECL